MKSHTDNNGLALLHCVKIHILHLKCLSQLCVFKCILKLPACKDAKSHWLHLCNLPPLCVFICLFKLPASADPKSHCLHLYVFLLLWVFKCLPKTLVWEDVKSHWLHLLGLFKRLLLIFVTIKTSWILSSQIFKSTLLRFWSMPCGSKYNFRSEKIKKNIGLKLLWSKAYPALPQNACFLV